jgi:hypothetical protein
MKACRKGDIATAEVLITEGANVDAKDHVRQMIRVEWVILSATE